MDALLNYNQPQAVVAPYPRYIQPLLEEALADSPAVLVHGPRQCGKTTLALDMAGASDAASPSASADSDGHALSMAGRPVRSYEYVNFDDPALRDGAEADPMGFVAGLPERTILDEVHRVPALFTPLKLAIDRRRTPGRFLLTGSTHVLLQATLADSLAGRLQTLRLHPLAQCELERTPPDFLEALFEARFTVGRTERLGPALAERVAAGGYPSAIARPAGRRRVAWYRDYLDSLVQRDVRDIADISRLDALPRLLTLAAVQTARLFNVSDLAAPFRISRPTIRSYVTLLERLFLLEILPPWHSNRLSRLVKTPKLHFGDTGLACALLGADSATMHADRSLLGQLLETFVFQELRRQASWHGAPLEFFHFRDKDKAEVDIVIERGARAVAGVEVKSSGTASKADFRGLRKLASAAGERFACGVVLYDGEATVPFGHRLFAVPLRRLWQEKPREGSGRDRN